MWLCRPALYDGELVAAEAGHQIIRPYGMGKPAGNLGQKSVADSMPVLIVDPLEAVQIKKEHCEWSVLVARGKTRLEFLQKYTAVWKTRP